jgi:serine/threonine-protein kinase
MGEVYKARDTRLDRIVAIKVLPTHLADRSELRERFEREAKTIASLNHPHICTLFDTGQQDGVDFLVMEYLEGETLAQRLVKGALPLEQVLQYAVEISDALDKAHRKGITHRDLKPGNIMLTKSGTKLLDFGLAKLKQEVAPANVPFSDLPTAADPLTAQGSIVGTLQYMAPEQLEGTEVDARTDIFAFGAVVYEMATGKKAFEGKTSASVMAKILEVDPPPMSSLQPMTPPALDRVVRRCLAKEPDERCQSAKDLTDELKWIAEGGSPITSLPTAPAKGFRTLGRQALMLGVGALLLVAAIAALAAWNLKPSSPQPIDQSVLRLDLDLGPGVSLGSTTGPSVILSPDGTRLVFNSQGADGTRHLFTRRLDQPKATQMPGTEGASAPFFSPDGQWVGFFGQGKLKKTRIDSGEPVTLCDAPSGRGASWGEDGNIIAALDAQVGLSQVPPEGGKAVSVTELDLEVGEVTHRWPQVLPGGKAVLFTSSIVYGNFDEAEIAVVSLKDHRRKTLLKHAGMFPRYLPSGHLIYVTKGTLFAVPFDLDRLEVRGAATLLEEVSGNPNLGFAELDFSRSGTLAYRTGGTRGLMAIQWVDGAGGTASFVTEPAYYQCPHFSPDGSRLAYSVSQGSSMDLWIYDLQRGSSARLTNGLDATYPVWSPDGQFVVFQAAGGLFWTRADGAGKPQRLIQSKGHPLPTSFTPDGTRVVFSELTPGAGAEIRTMPVESGSGQLRAGEPQVFLKTAALLAFPAISPDGRWLAYADAEAGSYEVYVRAFPDKGTKVQISNAGGTMPVWSRNGRELFYRTEDQRIMVANYTVKGGTFVADKPRVWFGKQLANIGLSPNFDLAPDGKRFAVLMPAQSPEPRETQSHVTLALNFFDDVRRRTTTQAK